MDVNKYKQLLIETGYDTKKTKYLTDGFRYGFDLNYKGGLKGKRFAPNLKFRIGSPVELWNKVMNEVHAERYVGPFKEEDIPFRSFIQSPIGLVPKDKGTKTRLIFHLSYPKEGDSVNSGIPRNLCTVKYPDFNDAVRLCMRAGKAAFCATSDMSMAFRNVPLMKRCWKLLLMKAQHPTTGVIYYFYDKCLPFGSSISCSIFQSFSDSVAHIVTYITHEPLINYLDDYLFVAYIRNECNEQVQVFLNVCKDIQFPVSLEKTHWGAQVIIFLGLLLDTIEQEIGIPMEKIRKARNLIEYFLNKKNHKATVLQTQQLCGVLNFICKAVVPGRAFLTRLYSLAPSNLKPHHHVTIKAESRFDLLIWKHLVNHAAVYRRPFIDLCEIITSEDVDMYSDASGSIEKGGFGAYCGSRWSSGRFCPQFMAEYNPCIEYLELFGVAVAVLSWIRYFPNRNLCLYTDNESVKFILNKSSANGKNCMVLLRLITLECMVQNVRLFAECVGTDDNGKADALSRSDFKRFRKLGPHMNLNPDPIPEIIWPMSKIWVH